MTRKMTPTYVSILAFVAFGPPFLLATSMAMQVDIIEIRVDDGRPLARAAQELERRYGWIITYEDPPYEFSGDIRDVTQSVRKDFDPSKPKVFVPRGGSFIFSYRAASPSLKPEPLEVVSALLENYHATGLAGVFRLLRTADILHIVPAMTRNSEGVNEPRESPLDVRITIDDGQQNALEVIEAIATRVSQSAGRRLGVGTVPFNLLHQTIVRSGAKDEPARTMLMRILAATGRKLSWQLFCSPGAGAACALNIHFVEIRAQ